MRAITALLKQAFEKADLPWSDSYDEKSPADIFDDLLDDYLEPDTLEWAHARGILLTALDPLVDGDILEVSQILLRVAGILSGDDEITKPSIPTPLPKKH